MSKLSHIVSDLLHGMSDAGNVIASKITTWLGVASISTGATLGVVNDTAAKVAGSGVEWTLQDYAAVVAVVGGITLVIKNLVDIYYRIKSKGKL
jgi:hypothetical protein